MGRQLRRLYSRPSSSTRYVNINLTPCQAPHGGRADMCEDSTDIGCFQGFLVFCGFQGLLHLRENRRGAIAL